MKISLEIFKIRIPLQTESRKGNGKIVKNILYVEHNFAAAEHNKFLGFFVRLGNTNKHWEHFISHLKSYRLWC